MNYTEFIRNRSQFGNGCGFDPVYMPDCAIDFQSSLIEWLTRLGRGAIFADCGLGKTLMQLAWLQNCRQKTNKPVLLLAPLAVGRQTVKEAAKFGIEAEVSRDGKPRKSITITNYERLHLFSPNDYAAVGCDESSCLKDFKSETKSAVGEFMRTIPYRGLFTATAAPNDYWELGTSSDVLGYLGYRDVQTTFFKMETQKDHLGWGRTKFRFRGHAEEPFWQWCSSWSRCLRKPSDIGDFDDSRFQLPKLIESEIVVQAAKKRAGMLFTLPANTLQEQREERRNSIDERCEMAASIGEEIGASEPCVFWCELNDEADRLEEIIPNSIQVSGGDSDDAKEEKFSAFSSGECKRLIVKPKIGAWGLNWQHCANTVVFPSHSFERYYQLIRRFYRFGQKRDVHVRTIVNEGEIGVLKSIARKSEQAERMFNSITSHMKDALHLERKDFFPESERIPKWLSLSK